jgi:hypothetical protein
MRWALVGATALAIVGCLVPWFMRQWDSSRSHDDQDAPMPYPMDQEPDFSPDGARVVFCTNRGPRAAGTIYELDLATQDIRPIGPEARGAWKPHYSPDGRRIVFSLAGTDVGVKDLATGQSSNLNSSADRGDVGFDPVFKGPDAVLYWRQPRHHAFNSILLVGIGPDLKRVKLEVLIKRNHHISMPVPSPDGKHIAYVEEIDDAGGSWRGGTTNICIWDEETQESRIAFQAPCKLNNLEWFPDNERLLVQARGTGGGRMPTNYILDSATGAVSALQIPPSQLGDMLSQIDIAPDGQWICYPSSSSEGFGVTLWKSRLNGSQADEVTHLPAWYYDRFPDREPINGCDTYYGNPDFDPLAQDRR